MSSKGSDEIEEAASVEVANPVDCATRATPTPPTSPTTKLFNFLSRRKKSKAKTGGKGGERISRRDGNPCMVPSVGDMPLVMDSDIIERVVDLRDNDNPDSTVHFPDIAPWEPAGSPLSTSTNLFTPDSGSKIVTVPRLPHIPHAAPTQQVSSDVGGRPQGELNAWRPPETWVVYADDWPGDGYSSSDNEVGESRGG